ncbi:hypothetical protein LTR56_026532 [Elasticomyces elasticus]|nr:hypothetical protein LTR56_026532 [Elasticomyces elasticus]
MTIGTPKYMLLALLFMLAFDLLYQSNPTLSFLESGKAWFPVNLEPSQHQPFARDFTAGNSTLGFEAILALSQGTKWRVDGMRAAARVSGIKLQVPAQPDLPVQFIQAFKEAGHFDSQEVVVVWLGHMELLKLVLQNGYGSALILEDDMDWDTRVRNQTRVIAGAIRALTNEDDNGQAPYGLGWDVLWMGHCGDTANINRPMFTFRDHTTVPPNEYRNELDRHITMNIREGERSVYYSENAACSFAYAVSAKGAEKLLLLASSRHGGAFDSMLMGACRAEELTCVSVNPEVFTSYHPAVRALGDVQIGDTGDIVDIHVGDRMGHTNNIRQSARCLGLFN